MCSCAESQQIHNEEIFQAAYWASPPVDLHWFFEISIRTEKKIQLVLTEILFRFKPITEKKISENWKKTSVIL